MPATFLAIQTDITTRAVGAIVNDANPSPLGGDEVDKQQGTNHGFL